jgi:hypothetical protein
MHILTEILSFFFIFYFFIFFNLFTKNIWVERVYPISSRCHKKTTSSRLGVSSRQSLSLSLSLSLPKKAKAKELQPEVENKKNLKSKLTSSPLPSDQWRRRTAVTVACLPTPLRPVILPRRHPFILITGATTPRLSPAGHVGVRMPLHARQHSAWLAQWQAREVQKIVVQKKTI